MSIDEFHKKEKFFMCLFPLTNKAFIFEIFLSSIFFFLKFKLLTIKGVLYALTSPSVNTKAYTCASQIH